MIDRRGLLRGLGVLGCSAAAHPFMTSVTLAGANGGHPLGDHRLVVIILRGAMDGLDVVRPVGAPELGRYRPGLIQQPGLDLDGFFAMNAGLEALMPLWQAGELAFVQATSTPYRHKRSHFDGQDLLEAGTAVDVPIEQVRDGWLNRLLQVVPGLSAETAFAVGLQEMRILRGPAPAREWAPETGLTLSPQARLLLDHVYHDDPLFRAAMTEALTLSDGAMMETDETRAKGNKLREVQRLTDFVIGRLQEETRIASFSLMGWDTHKAQAKNLGGSLARLEHVIVRLKAGLGPDIWGKTTILAMTEFGRTVAENGSGGTDHGTGGTMLVAGGAIRGGRVFGRWPGLAEADLFERRDLMPTSDVRAWAAHAMQGLFGLNRSVFETKVFPGLEMGADPGLIL
jgi:uncharacterized protein (DUF1501 family)